MKEVILLHNPNAGDEDHMKSDLINAIENEGYRCSYFSIKKDDRWKNQLEKADFVVVAGGDGTVRKVIKELKNNPTNKRITMAILPMGTANNLSKALALDKETNFENHVRKWKNSQRQRFDIGIIRYDGITDFFLEGAGYGVFPSLIREMDVLDTSHLDEAEDKLQLALEKLHDLIVGAEAQHYIVVADHQTYEGRYLLLEVMNIASIGPNLRLAPAAETDDGYLDIVAIAEEQRDAFAIHIKKLINREKSSFSYQTFRAKKLTIQSDDKAIHIDDKYIPKSNGSLTIEVHEHILDLLK